MPQEVVGEVTIRSSKSDPVIATAQLSPAMKRVLDNLGDILPPNVLVGPVTIRMSGDGREIMVGGAATAAGCRIHLDGDTGNVRVRDFRGNDVLRFDSQFALLEVGGLGNEGDIRVRNNNDAVTIHLDGNTGDISLANADVAEEFDVTGARSSPGTVMVLDEDGRVQASFLPYDRRVVGVVAGAGGHRPGLILDRREASATRRAPISIMGKVAVHAIAEGGPIRVGDLLTTSSSQGRAMAADTSNAPAGSVIGKALSPLAAGTGMVDMLVNLR